MNKLKSLLQKLENEEDNILLKRHFASVRLMMDNTTHDIPWTKQDNTFMVFQWVVGGLSV